MALGSTDDRKMRLFGFFCFGLLHVSLTQGQVVQWDISKRQAPTPILRNRQAQTLQETISNDKSRGGYFATCSVGTPPQEVRLQLDTGSSDIWIPSSSSSICAETSDSDGCTYGSFDYEESSSYEEVGRDEFNISYVDGSGAQGDYIADVFEIGNMSISNMTMGLGLQTTIPYGLAGVGYALDEALVIGGSSASSVYPNLPVRMQQDGLIATVAYSLWLNDLDASTGSILFGGIDTDKYQGDLTRINVYPDSQTQAYTSFTVALTSLEAVSDSGNDVLSSTEFPIPVVLDSGTTYSYLPQDLATQIWNEVGAYYSAQLALAVLPCSLGDVDGYFSFGLGGPSGPLINVTLDELVLPIVVGGRGPMFESGPYAGQEVCYFGIQNLTSSPYLLGDTFLRSAYVVYDLVNNEVAIAPTDFNSTSSNIVPFPSDGAQVPSATVAPSQAAITEVGTQSSPTYGASDGFRDGSVASIPAALDGTKIVVICTSMIFVMVGSGSFALL